MGGRKLFPIPGPELAEAGERHCYENARAERLNGILKQEYRPG
jgi:hypothetical protein